MKKVASFVCVVAFALGLGVVSAENPPELPKPGKEHAWLQQLEGEWETVSTFEEPGQPPQREKGTESVRLLGGFWAVSEHRSTAMGQPFSGIFTLGYDPLQKRYVGSWVDSMAPTLWRLSGALDAAGKVLTLEGEERTLCDGQLHRFRELIEIVDADHRTFTFTMELEGKFVTVMKISYTRKK